MLSYMNIIGITVETEPQNIVPSTQNEISIFGPPMKIFSVVHGVKLPPEGKGKMLRKPSRSRPRKEKTRPGMRYPAQEVVPKQQKHQGERENQQRTLVNGIIS